MVGAVSLQNSHMTSNIILDTSQKYSKATAMLFHGFKCKLKPKCGKIAKNSLTHLVFATQWALSYNMAGTVSHQNTAMPSNMILDTS